MFPRYPCYHIVLRPFRHPFQGVEGNTRAISRGRYVSAEETGLSAEAKLSYSNPRLHLHSEVSYGNTYPATFRYSKSDLLVTQVNRRSNQGQFGTTYSYRVIKGQDTNDGHYGERVISLIYCLIVETLGYRKLGLELARLAALPEDMLEVAEQVACRLEVMQEKGASEVLILLDLVPAENLYDFRRTGHASSESRFATFRRKLLMDVSKIQRI